MKALKFLWAIVVGFLCCPDAYCDGAVQIYAQGIEPNKYSFNDLLNAIAVVESGGDPNALNEKEQAAGLYQIRPIYLADVNRILNYPRYRLADRFDPEKSREIVGIYLRHYGKDKTLEDMAAIHCSGPKGHIKRKTSKQIQEYVQKVRRVLEDGQ